MSPLFPLGPLAFLLAAPQQGDIFEVCMSPGCVADGAQSTLDKLQALAQFPVQTGKCQSLCGKGPIVIQNPDEKKVLYKYIKGDKVTRLLQDLETEVPAELVEGYDMAMEAESFKFSPEKAIELFQQSIEKAAGTAKSHGGDLSWLVGAYRGLAEAQLATKDLDGAFQAIQEAVELSKGQDFLVLETKARVCQSQKDLNGEYEALKALFALPEDPNMPRDVTNRKRMMGFRLQKLEKEVTM